MQNKKLATWQEKLETTEKNAIEFLGECFRVGGADVFKIADLETDLNSAAAKEAENFAELMGWINTRPFGTSERHGECMITATGLRKLREVRAQRKLGKESI